MTEELTLWFRKWDFARAVKQLEKAQKIHDGNKKEYQKCLDTIKELQKELDSTTMDIVENEIVVEEIMGKPGRKIRKKIAQCLLEVQKHLALWEAEELAEQKIRKVLIKEYLDQSEKILDEHFDLLRDYKSEHFDQS